MKLFVACSPRPKGTNKAVARDTAIVISSERPLLLLLLLLLLSLLSRWEDADVPTLNRRSLPTKWQVCVWRQDINQSHKGKAKTCKVVLQVCQDQVLLLFLPRVTTPSCGFVGSTNWNPLVPFRIVIMVPATQQRNDVTKNDDDKQEEAKTMIGMTTTQGPMANEAWLDEEVTKACEDLSLSQPPFEAATTEEQEQGNDVRYSHIKYWIDWSRTHQVLTQNTKNLVVQ